MNVVPEVVLLGTGQTSVGRVPTSAHLPLPWIMAYDLEPLVTLETKRGLLAQAAEAGWTLIFEHDPVRATGRVVKSRKSYEYQEIGGA